MNPSEPYFWPFLGTVLAALFTLAGTIYTTTKSAGVSRKSAELTSEATFRKDVLERMGELEAENRQLRLDMSNRDKEHRKEMSEQAQSHSREIADLKTAHAAQLAELRTENNQLRGQVTELTRKHETFVASTLEENQAVDARYQALEAHVADLRRVLMLLPDQGASILAQLQTEGPLRPKKG